MTSFNLSVLLFSLILFFSISVMIKNISQFNKSQNNCIQLVTRLQQKHRLTINTLIGLNPLAYELRLESKAAKKAIKAAPDPYSKSAAVAWYTSVKVRQNTLRLSQIAILKSGDQVTSAFRLKGQTKNQYLDTKGSLENSLYKDPSSSLSPSYYLRSNFKSLKEISSKTNFKFKQIRKNTINQISSKKSKRYYKCNSTITRKNKSQVGDIKIVADKHSLKHLAF